MSDGLLGTAAPRRTDLVLLLEIALGLALLVGAWLAQKRRFRQHAICQSAAVLLNLAVVVVGMVPSFRQTVYPKIPARLGRPFYGLATAHAFLGSVAQLVGLYVLLSAGSRLLPQKLRIENYKLWMRTALALWWAVILLGIATYMRWYVPH